MSERGALSVSDSEMSRVSGPGVPAASEVAPGFGWLDVSVTRNAYGSQRDSFVATSDDGSLPLVFIRAPRIDTVGPGVTVLATLDGIPVLVRQGTTFGATFHPELGGVDSVHAAVFGGLRQQACSPDDGRRSSGGEARPLHGGASV